MASPGQLAIDPGSPRFRLNTHFYLLEMERVFFSVGLATQFLQHQRPVFQVRTARLFLWDEKAVFSANESYCLPYGPDACRMPIDSLRSCFIYRSFGGRVQEGHARMAGREIC